MRHSFCWPRWTPAPSCPSSWPRAPSTHADVSSAIQHGLVDIDSQLGTLQFVHPLPRSTVDLAVPADVVRRIRRWGTSSTTTSATGSAPGARPGRARPGEPPPCWSRAPPTCCGTGIQRGRGRTSEVRRPQRQPRHRARRLGLAADVGADVTGDLDRVAGLLADARRGAEGETRVSYTAVAAAYLLLNGDGDVDTAYRLLEGAL